MPNSIRYDMIMLAARIAIQSLEYNGYFWDSKLKDTDCLITTVNGKEHYQFTAAYAKQVINRYYLLEYCDLFSVIQDEFPVWWITKKPKDVTQGQARKDVKLIYKTLLSADAIYAGKQDTPTFDRAVDRIIELLLNRCKFVDEQIVSDKKPQKTHYDHLSVFQRSESDGFIKYDDIEVLPTFSKEERDMLQAHCALWDKKSELIDRQMEQESEKNQG